MAHSKDIVANLNNFKEKHGIKGIVFALVIVALILTGAFYFFNRGYTGIKVINSISSGANASVKYRTYNGMIIRYSNDGITCLNERFESLWSQGYSMQDPMVDICGDYVAVGDPGGEDMFLFDSKGLVKKINITYTLEDFKVSGKGGIFTVLTDGDRKYMKYYDREGELIAEGMVQLKKTGYPLSFDVSEDGRLVIMSYLFVSNGVMKTNVSFYNFDSGGEAALDRIVSSFEYKDTVIPEVRFFGSDCAVAAGDTMALVYEGADTPALKKTIEYPREAESFIFDKDRFGIVFQPDEESTAYKAEVYKSNGSKLSAFNIDMTYDNICFSGNHVLAYSDSQCKLITLSGNVRLDYTFESRITGMIPVNGKERFILITNESVGLISLI